MSRDRLQAMTEQSGGKVPIGRALLFAPPPAPVGQYRILLETDGFDVLVAQDPTAVESLLRNATVQRIIAVAPALDPSLSDRWRALSGGVGVEVIAGLTSLLDERVAHPVELTNFTIRSLTTLIEILSPARGIPAKRCSRRLELTEYAAVALRLGARDSLAVRLTAVLFDAPELLRISDFTDSSQATTPGDDHRATRERIAQLAAGLGSPFPLGSLPEEPSELRPPVAWEIAEAAERLIRLEEREAKDLATLLRSEVSRLNLHPGAVEAVLAGLAKGGQERGFILIVDPDAAARHLLALRLGNEGFRVVTVADGRSALAEIARENPDLVLAEVVLSGLDGYGLLDKLTREYPGRFPFVFLSSRSDNLAVNKGLLLGADDFLTKPIDPEILLTRIRKILGEAPDRDEVSARIRVSEAAAAEAVSETDLDYDDLAPGVLIDRRFRVEEDLGEGGMGKILRAWDLQLEENVVIKVMRIELGRDPRVLEHFKREIRLARRIAHPGVVRIYDFWEVGSLKFVTMEYLKGRDLRRELQARGPFPVPVVLRIGEGVFEALAAAHEVGVVHRDVKPHNVVLLPSGRVKVLDFGIAQGLERDSPDGGTLTAAMVGTPEYMSPEQLMGERVDEMTDLYSGGVLLYELLTGDIPFRGESRMASATLRLSRDADPPSARNPQVPPELDELVLKLLSREKDRRPPSASAAAAALAVMRA